MKNTIITLLTLLSILGCQKENINNNSLDNSNESIETVNPFVKQNEAIARLSQHLATALTGQEFRAYIHDAFEQYKSNDEYEVLITDMNNIKSKNGIGFSQLLEKYSKYQTNEHPIITDLNDLTTAFSRIQISIPVNFEKWNYNEESPYVAFLPAGVDDEELLYIDAYDKDGNSLQLDANVKPEFPVVVVGFNEKLSTNEHVNSNKTETSSKTLMLKRLRVYDIQEPWTKGAAEVYLSVKDESHIDNPYDGYLYVSNEISIKQDQEGVWSGDKLWTLFDFNATNTNGDNIDGNIVFYFIEVDIWDNWPLGACTCPVDPSWLRTYSFSNRTYSFWGYSQSAFGDPDDYIGAVGTLASQFSVFSGTTYSNPTILTSTNSEVKFSVYEK